MKKLCSSKSLLQGKKNIAFPYEKILLQFSTLNSHFDGKMCAVHRSIPSLKYVDKEFYFVYYISRRDKIKLIN